MTAFASAPPVEAKQSGGFIKLPPFKRSDTYVLTIIASNFIPNHPFDRKDEKTGQEYVKEAPAVELYLGARVDGELCLAKTWPQMYSLSDRANFRKWYEAATGKTVKTGDKVNVADLVGKALLGEVKVADKTSAKGTTYTANNVKIVGKVPSVLAGSITPLAELAPVLEKALAEAEKKDGDTEKKNPF